MEYQPRHCNLLNHMHIVRFFSASFPKVCIFCSFLNMSPPSAITLEFLGAPRVFCFLFYFFFFLAHFGFFCFFSLFFLRFISFSTSPDDVSACMNRVDRFWTQVTSQGKNQMMGPMRKTPRFPKTNMSQSQLACPIYQRIIRAFALPFVSIKAYLVSSISKSLCLFPCVNKVWRAVRWRRGHQRQRMVAAEAVEEQRWRRWQQRTMAEA